MVKAYIRYGWADALVDPAKVCASGHMKAMELLDSISCFVTQQVCDTHPCWVVISQV